MVTIRHIPWHRYISVDAWPRFEVGLHYTRLRLTVYWRSNVNEDCEPVWDRQRSWGLR